MGGVTMGLLKAFPRLKAIVQDLPDAVKNGDKVIITCRCLCLVSLTSTPSGSKKPYLTRCPAGA
jgi:hypothetical protein